MYCFFQPFFFLKAHSNHGHHHIYDIKRFYTDVNTLVCATLFHLIETALSDLGGKLPIMPLILLMSHHPDFEDRNQSTKVIGD